MHKIDGAGVAPGGLFRLGIKSIGQTATTVTADWSNAVQSELVNAIEFAGMTLNKADNTQLRQAIQALVSAGATPIGTVIEGYWTAAPSGFALAAGELNNRVGVYAAIWAHAVANGLVVSDEAWLAGARGFFSSGNGSTTFRFPDLRGEFTRGWDNGRGVDAGRALGSTQSGQNLAHEHAAETNSSGEHFHASGQGAEYAPFGRISSGQSGPDGLRNDGLVKTGDAGAHTHVVTVSSSGGAEARPRNVALNKAIKI